MIIVKDQVSKILFQEYPKNEFDASDPRFLFLVFPKNFLKVLHYRFTVPKKIYSIFYLLHYF